MCLATTACVYAACAVCVAIFSTGSKFRQVSNFIELHALTLAARSCALLCEVITIGSVQLSRFKPPVLLALLVLPALSTAHNAIDFSGSLR